MYKGFFEFLDKKARQTKKQLGLMKQVFETNNMKVRDFMETESPYIFLSNTSPNPTFDGIRIYKIGETLAFRVQNESDTHPYGRSYMLDVEAMYNDLLADHKHEEKAAKIVIKQIIKELNSFFEQSEKAEKDFKIGAFENKPDSLGKIAIRSTGTDYANLVNSKS